MNTEADIDIKRMWNIETECETQRQMWNTETECETKRQMWNKETECETQRQNVKHRDKMWCPIAILACVEVSLRRG